MIKLIKNIFYNCTLTKRNLAKFVGETDIFSMSKWCEKFEKKFSRVQGRKYSVLFNSGGSANLALIQALKNLDVLKTGDNVGFTALTWSTNVMPIIQLGMVPVPIDVSVFNLNNDFYNFKTSYLLKKFKCAFLTNVLGFTGNLLDIKNYCDRNGIILIEDNCEGLGSVSEKRRAGNWGLASTFSFFIAHHLSTIEGGMVCTDDEALYNMLKIVRANGWDRNLNKPIQKLLRTYHKVDSFYSKYTFYDLAYNLRPTEITGFLGCEQMKYLKDIVNKREYNFKYFQELINNNDDFLHLKLGHMEKISAFAIPIICKGEAIKTKYMKRFEKAKVEIRPMIAGNIQKQPFYTKYVKELYNLPEADFVHTYGFYFGNHADYTKKELEEIGALLK